MRCWVQYEQVLTNVQRHCLVCIFFKTSLQPTVLLAPGTLSEQPPHDCRGSKRIARLNFLFPFFPLATFQYRHGLRPFVVFSVLEGCLVVVVSQLAVGAGIQ